MCKIKNISYILKGMLCIFLQYKWGLHIFSTENALQYAHSIKAIVKKDKNIHIKYSHKIFEGTSVLIFLQLQKSELFSTLSIIKHSHRRSNSLTYKLRMNIKKFKKSNKVFPALFFFLHCFLYCLKK